MMRWHERAFPRLYTSRSPERVNPLQDASVGDDNDIPEAPQAEYCIGCEDGQAKPTMTKGLGLSGLTDQT